MTQVNNEYASALFMLAQEEHCEKDICEALTEVLKLFGESPEYIEFLASPSIPMEERLSAIDKAFENNIHEYAVSFLKVLTERSAIRSFASCVKVYSELYREADKLSVARVTSAVELTEDEKTKLKSKLETLSKRTVILECVCDKSIIGGLIIEIDGKIMDGSVRHKLSEVKEVMQK